MQSDKLQKQLLARHVRMIAMGGMIGTGIFKGSADTVGLAGPGVIFSYLFAGVLLLIVMAALAEMAIVYPGQNMNQLIGRALGDKVSFVTGWLYVILWLVVCVIEVIAAGSFLQYWFTDTPLWALSLICALGIILLNSFSVKYYGEIEYWFAGLKIFVIIAFILLGAAILLGVIPSSGETPYFENYTDFVPNGWGAVFSTLLIVMFSYGGSELIGLTITEMKDAEKSLPGIVKGVMFRVILFYTLPILIICGLIPWDQIDQSGSPFVQVFKTAGLESASHVVNFILITAVLSAANSGIYGSTRMMHSLSASGAAPKSLSFVSKKGVPIVGLMISAVVLLAGSYIAYLEPDKVFGYLMAIPGFAVSFIWISICIAQLRLRRTYKKEPFFKIWGFPYVTLFAVIGLGVSFIALLQSEANRLSSTVCIGIVAILIILSFFTKAAKKNN
ncbi:AAT family amino acid transporter [Peribacillus deserti]|uniref:AAT family amino acid transporter n=1 Tax=Peribacillus deserti TaxID=673318 RepID=A0ABS2QKI3_9BACI|nr:amino acid permease [Peribacillus deserti]MBM7692786.1 AAT family amino acid transporter [Peribacillus deserti]